MKQNLAQITRHSSVDSSFKARVYRLVASIPRGRVMTYGQIAALCGSPGAARVVGQIAHFGPVSLPWHRVVNVHGGLARGFVPGGMTEQARLLQAETVQVIDQRLNLQHYLWWPERTIDTHMEG